MSTDVQHIQPSDLVAALHNLGIDMVRDPFAEEPDASELPFLLGHLNHAIDRIAVECATTEDWYAEDGGRDMFIHGTGSAAVMGTGTHTITSSWYLIHAHRAMLTADTASALYGESPVAEAALRTLRAGAALAMVCAVAADVSTEDHGLAPVMPPSYREDLAVSSLEVAERSLASAREHLSGVSTMLFDLLRDDEPPEP